MNYLLMVASAIGQLVVMLAAPIGLVWLLILGHWPIVVFGVIAGFLFPVAWFVASLPEIGLALGGVALARRGMPWLSFPLFFLAALWTLTLFLLWSGTVYDLFVRQMVEQGGRAVPLTLWGLGVLGWPLIYMTHKEQELSRGPALGNDAYIVLVFLMYGVTAAFGITPISALVTLVVVVAYVVGLALASFKISRTAITAHGHEAPPKLTEQSTL